MVLSERTCTGQLTSHPQSRDIQFENFSLLFHGHELIQDSTLELNYGRSGRKLPAYFGTALGGHLLRMILSSPADVRCQASAMSPRPCLTPACSMQHLLSSSTEHKQADLAAAPPRLAQMRKQLPPSESVLSSFLASSLPPPPTSEKPTATMDACCSCIGSTSVAPRVLSEIWYESDLKLLCAIMQPSKM